MSQETEKAKKNGEAYCVVLGRMKYVHMLSLWNGNTPLPFGSVTFAYLQDGRMMRSTPLHFWGWLSEEGADFAQT